MWHSKTSRGCYTRVEQALTIFARYLSLILPNLCGPWTFTTRLHFARTRYEHATNRETTRRPRASTAGTGRASPPGAASTATSSPAAPPWATPTRKPAGGERTWTTS